MDTNDMWDFLIDNEIATEDELRLVTDVAGFNDETMEAVLYSRTGYQDFDQWIEEYND